MAIYHVRIGNVSRKAGTAATATLAYITGEKVKDERLQKVFDYPDRRDRVQAVGVMLPSAAPAEWLDDPRRMIVDIECHEKQADARTCKKIEFALPRELSPGQRKELVETVIQQELVRQGYGAVYAIHDDPEDQNPHVHILAPNRKITQDGWATAKSKKVYKLDAMGQRIPVIDKATGKQKTDSHGRRQWQRVTVSGGGLLEKREEIKAFRQALEAAENRALEEAGRTERVDCRSLEDQGIDREPQIHVGAAAKSMERRGEPSERAEINQGILQRNAALARITQQLQQLAAEIDRLKERAKERAHETVAALLARARAQRAAEERSITDDGHRGVERGAVGLTGPAAGAAEGLAGREAEESAARAEAALRARAERDAAGAAQVLERAGRTDRWIRQGAGSRQSGADGSRGRESAGQDGQISGRVSTGGRRPDAGRRRSRHEDGPSR